MFYLSNFKYNNKGDKLYGITDTADNIEEYYTDEQLYNILKQLGFTSIKGVVYTGSKVKGRITTPVIEYIKELQKGTTFKLNVNNEIIEYKYLAPTSAADGFILLRGSDKIKLSNKYLISNKDVISIVSN